MFGRPRPSPTASSPEITQQMAIEDKVEKEHVK
jgi:hypothetical protein